MTDPGSYTFVPWFRRGVASRITRSDDPTSTGIGRASVQAAVQVAGTPVSGAPAKQGQVAKQIELVGPADIAALKTSSVLRTHPPADARDATPGELAYVEFYDEDLPWRYTPAAAATVTVGGQPRPQLRPWLALLVLAAGEFELHARTAGLPTVTVAAGVALPPPEEHWAWAHAQIAGSTTASAAGTAVTNDPNASLSRLLSPRRLQAGTLYSGFVVPAFETGRLAGLGADISAVPTLRPAWGPASTSRVFPVYYSWQFTVGTDGSFESYVRKLQARAVDDSFGKRSVSGDLSNYGLPDAVSFDVEGALQPPEFTRADFPAVPGADLVSQLTGLLDLAESRLQPGATVGDDPGIVPPTYGRWPAGVALLADVAASDSVAWIREANLDLRERAAAGLGARIVREQQDELIARAWSQVDALHDVNQRLREGELAVAAASALYDKHFAPVAPDELFLLSAASHHGLPVAAPTTAGLAAQPTPSIRSAVDASAIPSAVHDAAFKRATRPTSALMQAATGQRAVGAFRAGLVGRLNDSTVTAAPPVPAPLGSVSLSAVAAVVASAGSRMGSKADEPKYIFWTLVVSALGDAQPLPTVASLQASATTLLNTPPARDAATVSAVTELINAIIAVADAGDGTVDVTLLHATFTKTYGDKIAGKSGGGVTIRCEAPAPGQVDVARFADDTAAADYGDSVTSMAGDLAARRAAALSPPPLGDLATVNSGLHDALHPQSTLTARVESTLPGFAQIAAERAAAELRRLQPVMAYPTFADAMVTALQQLDQEWVLPNLSALPDDTLTLMTPNGRFLEALFLGLNTQLARELLWQEFPTDQRGTYFRVFWERTDALHAPDATDIAETQLWTAALGSNGSASAKPLVLVVRSELLRKYPNTLVYAQAAKFGNSPGAPHTLDQTAAPILPSFHATLDPDVALIGFAVTEDQARGRPPATGDPGDPGLFFVLAERPGQLRFGLDDTIPPGGLTTWDDLSWPALTNDSDHIELANNAPEPSAPDTPGVWAATAADMASILFRSPVMYARHASNMLPPVVSP